MTQPAASSSPPPPLPYWGRVLLPLLTLLAGLLFGWHLGAAGHSRLPEASQTSPVLPELRPLQSQAPSLQGVGTAAEASTAPPLTRWTSTLLPAAAPVHHAETDLIALGRMNLDGG